ncbi:MAG: NAD regulator [Maricaulaceae bacterium]
MAETDAPIVIGLNAVILAADEAEPWVLTLNADAGGAPALPFGPFAPDDHRTLEIGLRDWVRAQTDFPLGYVEQLYTFGDQGREAPLAELLGADRSRVISVGYLALTRREGAAAPKNATWAVWRTFFPWEDWRKGRPDLIDTVIAPGLEAWADRAQTQGARAARRDRARALFAQDGRAWNEERVLDRYELLYEAGLAPEASRDRARAGLPPPSGPAEPRLGAVMASDHRRILATAIGRVRGKLKYRPIVFDLVPETFTLSELQHTVEAILGGCLHKQNFRRALERAGLVEGTGQMRAATGGRPAELYRYRRSAFKDLPQMGLPTPSRTG